MTRAVFLDRDGTINVEREYLSDPNNLKLFPGVGPALQQLQQVGYMLFVVTNQSGIGRRYYTEEDMHRVNARLVQVLEPLGVDFKKIYFAPEAPEQVSRGRKPSPQFLIDAQNEFGVTLKESYMIGDKLSDIECGWNAGVKTSILVRTGYGSETETKLGKRSHKATIVDDLPSACQFILENKR